jgi:hypothetical protein
MRRHFRKRLLNLLAQTRSIKCYDKDIGAVFPDIIWHAEVLRLEQACSTIQAFKAGEG